MRTLILGAIFALAVPTVSQAQLLVTAAPSPFVLPPPVVVPCQVVATYDLRWGFFGRRLVPRVRYSIVPMQPAPVFSVQPQVIILDQRKPTE